MGDRIYQSLVSHRFMTTLLALFLSACTGVLAVGTAYDSAAGRFSKELVSYADFTSHQKKEIKTRVSAFQQWHRQNHLPQYRIIIDQITSALAAPRSIEERQLTAWVESARSLILQLSYCNPLNGSGKILNSLSDHQVNQIEIAIKDKHTERVRDYRTQTTEQRLEHRIRAISKWIKRAGVKMSAEQTIALKNTLLKQVSLSPRRHELWQEWSEQFIDLLHRRGTTDSESAIDRHIQLLWNLTENTYPDEWHANIKLWQGFLFEFFQLMTDDQAQRLARKLGSISNTLATLQNKPGKAGARCFAENPEDET